MKMPLVGAWRTWRAWLDAPLSGSACVLGWCVATAVFFLFVGALGGISPVDSYESVFSTWAMANGHAACAFPQGFNVTAPLYPMLSAGTVALEHVGRGTAFPGVRSGQCDTAFVAINTWSLKTDALARTLQVGVVGWLALLGGTVALLRSIGRGRRRWEPVVLVVLACLPPVWSCVQSTFHPEDLLAVGLTLAAVATALRDAWVRAGILIGLAVLSQQFALLAAIPLLFVAPPPRRPSYGLAAVVTVALVAVPLLLVTSGSAAHAIFLGTGSSHGIGGALVSELHLQGARQLAVARIFPLVLSAAAAWATTRRLGQRAANPVVVVSLVAFSLGLRLVFEAQIFEYYFMALSVALVLLDAALGRLRSGTAAWLLAVPVVFVGELSVVNHHEDVARLCVLAAGGAVLVVLRLTRAKRASLLPWVALIACTVLSWTPAIPLGAIPVWAWQVVLVSWGLCLAASPAVGVLRAAQPKSLPVAVRPGVPRFARPEAIPSS